MGDLKQKYEGKNALFWGSETFPGVSKNNCVKNPSLPPPKSVSNIQTKISDSASLKESYSENNMLTIFKI